VTAPEILVVTFLVMVFLVLFYKCFYKRFIFKSFLKKLPCYDYVARENISDSLDCAICLENFIIGDKCRLLPICKHSFHTQCVDKWLLKKPICPICRSKVCRRRENKVVIDNGGENIESGSSRNVAIELRENNPTLEVESQEH
jgi:hypothetical protein